MSKAFERSIGVESLELLGRLADGCTGTGDIGEIDGVVAGRDTPELLGLGVLGVGDGRVGWAVCTCPIFFAEHVSIASCQLDFC